MVQDVTRCILLGLVNGQVVVMFDINPSPDILALVRFSGRQPLSQVAVAFGLIDVVGNGKELRASDTTVYQQGAIWDGS